MDTSVHRRTAARRITWGLAAVLCWAAAADAKPKAKPVTADTGRFVTYQGDTPINEEVYTLGSDGTLTCTWKDLVSAGNPTLALALATKSGTLSEATLKWEGHRLSVKRRGDAVFVQADFPLPPSGEKTASVPKAAGTYLFDSLLRGTWQLILRHYDRAKGGTQYLPIVQVRETIGVLSLRITPKGSAALQVAGKPQTAQQFTATICAGEVAISGGIDLWATPAGALLRTRWGDIETVRDGVERSATSSSEGAK
jgi:hypothetical protein